MYRDTRNGRPQSTAASVGLLEPFESEEDWNVDWPRLRSPDVSSLTVQTLIAQPSGAATSVWSEFSDAVVTLALHSANPGVSNREWQTAAHGAANGLQPSTDRAKARALLRLWLAEDVNTSDRSMEVLKIELDQDRESGRKLFP
jgi:hypothetical protein